MYLAVLKESGGCTCTATMLKSFTNLIIHATIAAIIAFVSTTRTLPILYSMLCLKKKNIIRTHMHR